MFYNHYELLANQKQQEIELNAKEAWKFAVNKEESMIGKMMNKIKAIQKPASLNNTQDTCEVC